MATGDFRLTAPKTVQTIESYRRTKITWDLAAAEIRTTFHDGHREHEIVIRDTLYEDIPPPVDEEGNPTGPSPGRRPVAGRALSIGFDTDAGVTVPVALEFGYTDALAVVTRAGARRALTLFQVAKGLLIGAGSVDT